ncbi:serine/arginine-rich splicing factor 3 isoform X1 [Haliaeetus albicilla]|uniref:serine/arginine-rich splicing factor 3 isoform X1 n=1 Tax=Haliaeetus albicilla TaxID=8969 RepID=UPI0037E99146
MHRDSCPLDCKVYVGNLGNNGNKTELERAFGYYGPLRSVWVARNPPGFAFVEFEDPRDAADAVRELDGRTLCGCRVRVELSNGEKRSRNRGPPPSWGRRPRDDYRRRSPPPRRRSPRSGEAFLVAAAGMHQLITAWTISLQEVYKEMNQNSLTFGLYALIDSRVGFVIR